jgi:hypothetical protein
VVVNDSAAASTLFVASPDPTTGADMIAAGASAAIYGGAAGGTYTIGSTSFFFGAGTDSAGGTVTDTVTQTSLSAFGSNAIMFSNSGESLTLTNALGAMSVAGTSRGDVLFAAGEDTTVNANNSAGGNILLMDNQAAGAGSLPSAITGDSTLIGGTAGNSQFVMFNDNTTEQAHTVTIQDWVSSDTFVVSNVGGVGAFLQADINAINAFNAGSSGTGFTLSDGTTVNFVGGTQPHHVVMN